jgi:hypothetical protein
MVIFLIWQISIFMSQRVLGGIKENKNRSMFDIIGQVLLVI